MAIPIGAVYLVNEFGPNGSLLETYYYTSYLVGLVVVLIVLAVRRLVCGQPWERRAYTTCAAAVVVAPYVWKLAGEHLSVWTIPAVPLLVAAVMLAAYVQRWWRFGTAAAALVVSASPLLLTLAAPGDVPLAPGQAYRREPHYETSMFHPDHRVLDLYADAHRFMEIVPDWADSPGSVVFWYPYNDEPANMMGSTFLWYETALTIQPPGLPELGETSAAGLRDRTPRYIVVVASAEPEVTAGTKAIEHVVVPISSRRVTFSSGGRRLYADVLQFDPSSCDQARKGLEVYWLALPPC